MKIKDMLNTIADTLTDCLPDDPHVDGRPVKVTLEGDDTLTVQINQSQIRLKVVS